ncbi:M48 family metallopeptidase [Egicoccus sp. AB-alg6-2]|uniref:M48 metallopeptidase family protein n=1 Tax=Egicoccus sp. AB-alg6-2 TaxID=3242692 RepID=UPI00359DA1B7
MPVEHRPAAAGRPELHIHRSPKRRRSASAAPEGGRIVVRLPAGLEQAEEERLIDDLVDKVTRRRSRDRLGGDAALEARARRLAQRHLDGVAFSSVRWSARMGRRHGSCTPATGEIRISDRLAQAPTWVLDAVLVHELAHLLAPDHGPDFAALVARYPQAERARGWLEGFAAGQLASATPSDDQGDQAGSSPEGSSDEPSPESSPR